MTGSLPATEFEALRDHLLEYSVKRGDFVLKSGLKSKWFIDSKQTVCRPESMVLVAEGVLSVIPAGVNAIGGLTMGADPVSFITAGGGGEPGSDAQGVQRAQDGQGPRGWGRIAGALDPGDRVVVTEDTVSRGNVLAGGRAGGDRSRAVPALLVAVVDRGGTVEAMAAAEGLPFRALLTAPDLGFEYEGGA